MCVDPANCGGWCAECQSLERSIHVIPIGDLREHEESVDCWCRPTLDDQEDIFVHHSLDRREEYEEGMLPS